MKTKNNFKSENEIRVAIINLLGTTSEPFVFGKSVTVGEKGSKTKIAAIEVASETEVYITAESNSDICWDDLTLAEQKKLFKAIEKQFNSSINNQNPTTMEEVKNNAAETAQVENENVEQQAPQVENQEQAEAPAEAPAEEAAAEEQPAAEEKKEPELVIPAWEPECYESASILLAKSIEEVDKDIEADEKLPVVSFKQLVECWPGARFTPTAKTKGVVTAGTESMKQLTETLQKMYKRSILIKAL